MDARVNPCLSCYYARMRTDVCGIYCAGHFWKEEDGTCKHYEKWTQMEGEEPHLDTDILEEAGFEL